MTVFVRELAPFASRRFARLTPFGSMSPAVKRAPRILRPVVAAFAAAFLLVGCADLSAIRAFARNSAKLAASREVTTDLTATYARKARLANPAWDADADPTYTERTRLVAELLAVQTCLAEYMDALGALAADEAVSDAGRVGKITDALSTHTFISAETADASKRLGELVFRAATDRWRRAKLQSIIREAEPHLQAAVSGLSAVAKAQARTAYRDEQARLIEFLEDNTRGQQGSAAQAQLSLTVTQRLTELDARRQAAADYLAALSLISQGHTALAADPGPLTRAQLLADLRRITGELAQALDALEHAHGS